MILDISLFTRGAATMLKGIQGRNNKSRKSNCTNNLRSKQYWRPDETITIIENP